MSHLTSSLSECIRHSRLWSGNRLRHYSNLCLHGRGITAVWRKHAVLHVNRIYLSTGIASACRPAGTISVVVAHSHPNNGSSDYVLLFKQTRPERRGQSAGHSYSGFDKHPLKLPPSTLFQHYAVTTSVRTFLSRQYVEVIIYMPRSCRFPCGCAGLVASLDQLH